MVLNPALPCDWIWSTKERTSDCDCLLEGLAEWARVSPRVTAPSRSVPNMKIPEEATALPDTHHPHREHVRSLASISWHHKPASTVLQQGPKTSDSPETLQAISTGLGLLRQPALWLSRYQVLSITKMRTATAGLPSIFHIRPPDKSPLSIYVHSINSISLENHDRLSTCDEPNDSDRGLG